MARKRRNRARTSGDYLDAFAGTATPAPGLSDYMGARKADGTVSPPQVLRDSLASFASMTMLGGLGRVLAPLVERAFEGAAKTEADKFRAYLDTIARTARNPGSPGATFEKIAALCDEALAPVKDDTPDETPEGERRCPVCHSTEHGQDACPHDNGPDSFGGTDVYPTQGWRP